MSPPKAEGQEVSAIKELQHKEIAELPATKAKLKAGMPEALPLTKLKAKVSESTVRNVAKRVAKIQVCTPTHSI